MKCSYTKNPESELFFNKESKSNKKIILEVGRGGVEGEARVSDFLFFFFQKNPSLKKIFLFSF